MMPGQNGPVRRPRALRIVEGEIDAEAAAAVSVADEIRPGIPERPAGMSDAETVMFDDLVSKLDRHGLVADIDGMTIDLMLRHYLAATKASDELNDADSVAVWDEKNERHAKHPADAVFRMQSEAALKYLTALGMNLVSRARMQAKGDSGDGDVDNPFAQTS